MLDDDATNREARLKARAELEAEAARHAKRGKMVRLVGAALVIAVAATILLTGRFTHSTIVSTRETRAVHAFMKACKRLGDYHGTHHFNDAESLFQDVLRNRPDWAEASIYLAACRVLTYQHEKTATPTLLDDAERFVGDAQKSQRDYPDAHYYLAAISWLRGNTKGARACLDECANSATRYYAKDPERRTQWLDKASAARAAVERGQPMDLLPVRAMLPAYEFVKAEGP